MILRKHLVPLVTHEVNLSAKTIESTINAQICEETEGTENLMEILDGLYAAVYKKIISYEKIHHYLVYIYEYILEGDNCVKNDLFIRFLFEIELLVQNFYYEMRQKIVNEDLHTLFGLNIINIEYPIFRPVKQLNLLTLINKLHENNCTGNQDVCNLIVGFLLLQKDTKLVENFLANNKSRLMVNFICNHTKSKLFDDFFDTNCEVFKVNKFYLEDIDKKVFIEKCFANNVTHIQQQLILQSKSHYYIDTHFQYMIQNPEFETFFLDTSRKNDQHTYSIIHKLLDHDVGYAEHLLKRIIIKHNEMRYKNIFFDKATLIDPEFIDITILYMDSVNELDQNLFEKIVNSEYFDYFTRDVAIYKDSINRLLTSKLDRNAILNTVENLFGKLQHGNEKVYYKMNYFLKKFPELRQEISPHCIRMFKNSHENTKCKCKSFTSEESFSNLVANVSDLSLSNMKYNNIMFELINSLRDQSLIHEHIPDFIEHDPIGFVDHCFDTENFVMDVMLLKAFDHLKSQVCNISSTGLLNNYLSYLKRAKIKDYYWDLILRKNISRMQLYKNYSLSNFEKDVLIDYLYDHHMLIDSMIDSLQATSTDYDQIEKILKRLESDNKYYAGLVMKESSITFSTTAKSFCFYGTFHQYDLDGEQGLIQLQGDNFSCYLGLQNGNLVRKTQTNGIMETFLLNNEMNTGKTIHFGLKLNRDKLKLYYNSSVYLIDAKRIKEIKVGKGFRGVLSKMLWHENSKYNKQFFDATNDFCAYSKFIKNLEKTLAFQNDCGFYLHNCNPYFFGRKTDVELKGIIMNRNTSWIENNRLRDLLHDKMANDEKLLEIFDKYIPNELQVIVRK